MAVLFSDSFDHYATAEITQKWTSTSGATITANGRNGTSALRINGAGGTGRVTKTVAPVSTTAGGVGFAYNINTLHDQSSNQYLVGIEESGTLHLGVQLLVSGLLAVYRGTTLLGTSSSGLSAGSFYYIEFKFAIHDSTGTVDLKLNGTSVLSLTGQDTRNGGTGVWNVVALELGVNLGYDADYDDLVVWDTSGSVNNDFLGPIRIKAIYPDGAGNTTNFTPSAGSNFQNVDEASTDGDTTYNSEGTPGEFDLYTYGAVGVAGTVRFVQVNPMVRSDGAGSETVRPKIRIGSTNYDGTTVGVSTSYLDKLEVFNVSPATSTAWTVAEIDGAEFGEELVS